MAQVTYPGVYIQEIPSGFRAISGVSTSIAAFIGMCKRGPLLTPTRVLGLKDYERIFSPDTSQGEMTEQVRQFFINKGEQAWIVRVAAKCSGSEHRACECRQQRCSPAGFARCGPRCESDSCACRL